MGRSGSFQAPPGFRDSPARGLQQGDVVASTYSIRDEIARTDTGVVFEARDMMLDRLVALKLAWRDPGMPSLILEARRCAAVRDPCAVAIYGMGNHQGVEYVVGERVTGRLLGDVLVKPLGSTEHLARFRTLVAAVMRAHEAGIAVGDISGSTVQVCDEERMVLGRVSLSQVPAFGPLGQILAPEVVRGEVEALDPSAAEAIDLYGLGCVAIESSAAINAVRTYMVASSFMGRLAAAWITERQVHPSSHPSSHPVRSIAERDGRTASPLPVPNGTIGVRSSTMWIFPDESSLVVGEVINNTSGRTGASIEVTYFDIDDNPIGTSGSFTDLYLVGRGAISPFEIPDFPPAGVDHYQLDVVGDVPVTDHPAGPSTRTTRAVPYTFGIRSSRIRPACRIARLRLSM